MAFEELVEHAERHRAAGELDAFESAAQAALALYRGPFLPAEEPSPWVMAARDRLAQQARQLVLALGTRLESTARAAHACTLYEAGLMIDSLSEPLYQGLMRAQLSLGQSAEAMQAYRRCREMLSVVLGIAPSAESMALFRRAQAQAQAVDHP
jgi:DNA-binding SARP family transcriptional activator